MGPASLYRHPKYVFSEVFLWVFGISVLVLGKLGVIRLESFGDILQENETVVRKHGVKIVLPAKLKNRFVY